MVSPITDEVIGRAVTALVKKHGEAERARIEIGVKQAAARWRETDGTAEDFEAVCLEGFAATPEDRAVLLERFEDNLEQLLGHLHEVQRYLFPPGRETSSLCTVRKVAQAAAQSPPIWPWLSKTGIAEQPWWTAICSSGTSVCS